MGSSDTDPSVERPSWARFLAVVTLVVFGSSILALVSSVADGLLAAGIGAALLVGLSIAFLGRRSATLSTDRSGADDSSDSNVWNAIPSWQYDGRHAESGGLARGEQEQALREIQQEAEELSGESQETDPER